MITQELFDAIYTILESNGVHLTLHRPSQYTVPEPTTYISNISIQGQPTKDLNTVGEVVFSFITWTDGDDIIDHSRTQMEITDLMMRDIKTANYEFYPTNGLNMMITENTYQEQNIRTGTFNFHWMYRRSA